MMSANLFARITKSHIALPCQWKKEWTRTISSSGYVMKEDLEGDKNNTRDNRNKPRENVRTNKKNRVKQFDATDTFLKPVRASYNVNKHLQRILEDSPPAATIADETILKRTRVQPLYNINKHIQRIMDKSTDAKVIPKLNTNPARPIKAPYNVQKHVLNIMGAKADELSKEPPIEVQNLMKTYKSIQSHVQRFQTKDERSQSRKTENYNTTQRRTTLQAPPTSYRKRTGVARLFRGPEPGPEASNYILEVLNNFSPKKQTSSKTDEAEIASLGVWNALKERDLQKQVTHSPRSAFEEMIAWTEKGTLWKFPINNEEGMVEEENVHFSEHIFLDQHLEDWCPTTGPIRHYMELVCLGLSKNPYCTVAEKVKHIMWYKKYFTDQITILEDLGAWNQKTTPESEELHDENEEQQQLA